VWGVSHREGAKLAEARGPKGHEQRWVLAKGLVTGSEGAPRNVVFILSFFLYANRWR